MSSSQPSFHQHFTDKLHEWKQEIKKQLTEDIGIADKIAEKIPIIPVGNVEPSIDLSDDEYPTPNTHYHWLSELLLRSLAVTEVEGLPSLIKANKKRIRECPNEYHDIDAAHRLVTKAQCSMFSEIGFRKEKDIGEAIGLILGTNEELDW